MTNKETGALEKPDNPYSFEIKEENMEAFEKEMKELHEIETKIERRKIPLNDLESVGLTPDQLMSIEALVLIDEEGSDKKGLHAVSE